MNAKENKKAQKDAEFTSPPTHNHHTNQNEEKHLTEPETHHSAEHTKMDFANEAIHAANGIHTNANTGKEENAYLVIDATSFTPKMHQNQDQTTPRRSPENSLYTNRRPHINNTHQTIDNHHECERKAKTAEAKKEKTAKEPAAKKQIDRIRQEAAARTEKAAIPPP